MGFLFGFRGRFNRSQWWGVNLLAVLVYFALLIFIRQVTGGGSDENTFAKMSLLSIMICIATTISIFWMSITASIKRYHDHNKHGWRYLVCITPIVGPIWQMGELGFLRGTDGPNDFDVDSEKSAPYVSRQTTQTITVAAAPARRLETATARTSFGQKPGFGTRRE